MGRTPPHRAMGSRVLPAPAAHHLAACPLPATALCRGRMETPASPEQQWRQAAPPPVYVDATRLTRRVQQR